MRIEKILTLTTVALALATPFAAAGGGDNGHGGMAWVCRTTADPNSPVIWADLVDLWEMTNQYPQSPGDDFEGKLRDSDVSETLNAIQGKIAQVNPKFAEAFGKQLKPFREKHFYKLPNAELVTTNDANFAVRPMAKDCSGHVFLEQVVNYERPNKIDVQTVVLSELIQHGKHHFEEAALYTHEAIYSIFWKNRPVRNSDRARKLVALLFSDKEPASYAQEFVRQDDTQVFERGGTPTTLGRWRHSKTDLDEDAKMMIMADDRLRSILIGPDETDPENNYSFEFSGRWLRLSVYGQETVAASHDLFPHDLWFTYGALRDEGGLSFRCRTHPTIADTLICEVSMIGRGWQKIFPDTVEWPGQPYAYFFYKLVK